MNLFDRLADRVGDFLDEVMLPEEIRFLHERARTSIRRGDYRAALRLLGEAEHRRPGVERTRHLRALCHFYLGNIDRSIELFDEALSLREEASSHFYLGLCHEQREHFADAQIHFQRALELDPNAPFLYDLHFGLGRAFLALNRPDKATRELRRALRVWPHQRDATVVLAEALRRRDRLDEARELLHEAHRRGPPDRDTLLSLGRIEAADQHHAAAAEAFHQILEQHPDDDDALLGSARSLLAIGEPAKANQHLLRALDSASDDAHTADIYALIGETNERIHNLDRAAKSYDAALQRAPDHRDALLGSARTHLAMGDHEQAAQHFARLLQDPHGPTRAQSLLGMGRCRLAEGDLAGARHLLEQAEQLHRDPPAELLHALGQISLADNDPAEALVAFQTARHAPAPPDSSFLDRLQADTDTALLAIRPDLSIPDAFDSTSDLVTTLTDLRDTLANEPRLESFLPRVHDLLHTLDQPLAVAVLGEFNAGKSTLVNAILGEDVVPTGVLPTTAHPLIMGYGPRKGARIVYEDGRQKDVDFATARTLMRDEAQEILRLLYTYPHPELRSLNFWDTPGFNALDTRHECLAAEALEDAEAILWMLDANQALKDSEFDRLLSIPDSSLRVILVVNKIDRFGDPEERREPLQEVLEYLHDHTDDDVLDIVAISALEARQDPDSPGFQKLLSLLDEQLVQRSWQIKISEVSRALHTLLDDIDHARHTEIDRFQELLHTADSLRELVADAAGDPDDRAATLANELSDRLDFVTLGIEREVSDALRRRGRLLRRLVLEPDDRDFTVELFRERLHHVLQRSRHGLLQEIADFEAQLTASLSPLLSSLHVTDARALRRRVEGYFDETRALKTLLDERVFGQWQARADGQISAGADSVLDRIVALGSEAKPTDRRALLDELIPSIDDRFRASLAEWYGEFFLAARRFCDRLHRDLSTLELDIRYRLDLR